MQEMNILSISLSRYNRTKNKLLLKCTNYCFKCCFNKFFQFPLVNNWQLCTKERVGCVIGFKCLTNCQTNQGRTQNLFRKRILLVNKMQFIQLLKNILCFNKQNIYLLVICLTIIGMNEKNKQVLHYLHVGSKWSSNSDSYSQGEQKNRNKKKSCFMYS